MDTGSSARLESFFALEAVGFMKLSELLAVALLVPPDVVLGPEELAALLLLLLLDMRRVAVLVFTPPLPTRVRSLAETL